MGVEPTKKNRIEYLDVARGLTMILIVVWHVLGENVLIFHRFFVTLGLQVFLFVSGYFFRGFHIKNNLIKLVLPFAGLLIGVRLFWNIKLNMWSLSQVGDIIMQILLGDTIDTMWQEQGIYVGIAWFLPMLVSSRLVYAFICKLGKDNYFIKGFVAVVISCIGVIIGNYDIELPWSFDVAMATTFFMFFGDFAHKYRELVEDVYQKIWFVPMCLVAWGITFYHWGYSELTFRTYPNGMTYLIISTLSMMVMFALCYFISNHFKILTKLFTTCGKYSFAILCGHVIDKSCITHSPNMNVYLLAVWELFLACIPVIVICLFKWVKGRVKHENVEQ